ncbi:hypothetical protein CLOM_g5895 [Closterium sp. NIES-68]|nr:hypothetical protein CLOM_g5895 [Closterium sp. NIES-68]GJP76447.1 hypothetical protein CLOP_g6894 [Closterium sp. NIES-67]
MTSSSLLQLASPPSPLPLAYDVRPTSLRGGNDFWAFFQQQQDKLEETTRHSFSDQSEASACSELREDPEGREANADPRVDEDGREANAGGVRNSDGGVTVVKTSSSTVSPQGFLQQQLSLPERRSLGPPVQGSYLSKREDDKGKKPLFSFGVITDVQYADINDGHSFLGIPRFYRHSLEVVKQAVEDWNQSARPMSFAVHFGDIVDGFCPRDRSVEAVNTVLDALAGFTAGPTYHMIGNHCLYNLPRLTLNKMLAIPTAADNRSYYDFSPYPNFRLVVLDSYDVSLLGWPEDHPHAVRAREVLERENPNDEKNSPEGLEGLNRRFVKFNGGVGDEQLRWLEGVLAECDALGETVVLCCHQPIEPTALPTATCLVWNYDKVLATIHRHECVAAVIAGHAHFGAYALDAKGIHHRILEGAVECPPGTVAFGHIDVYQDRLCIIGKDRMLCTEMRFPPRSGHSTL